MKFQLISLGNATDRGNGFGGFGNTFIVWKNDTIKMIGHRLNNSMANLWALATPDLDYSSIKEMNVTLAAPVFADSPLKSSLSELHLIFGHRNPEDIIKLANSHPGIVITDKTWNGCDSCYATKMARTVQPKEVHHLDGDDTLRDETLSMDIVGPLDVTGLDGSRYLLFQNNIKLH